MPVRTWGHLTTLDVAALDPVRTVAVLPVGAVEQHGPHLPLATDILISEGILQAAGKQLSPEVCLLILPSQAVGLSPEHMNFAGTLSHEAETLLASWTEIGMSVAAAGLCKLIILNSHGGQPQIVDLTTQRLRSEAGMLAVRANSFRFDLPPDLVSAEERAFGLHGGQIETALMLALHPDLVRRDKIMDFPNSAAGRTGTAKRLGLSGAGGYAWNAEDLHPSGATGNASRATAEQGAALLAAYAAQLAELITDVADWPLTDGAPFGAAP
ncbi:creatininase family protein [Nisaea sp.]|uniref:creatininase family protein n=1 Tax=Nisaea sp. TaxID=2024842 RepID=UPI0032EAD582